MLDLEQWSMLCCGYMIVLGHYIQWPVLSPFHIKKELFWNVYNYEQWTAILLSV